MPDFQPTPEQLAAANDYNADDILPHDKGYCDCSRCISKTLAWQRGRLRDALSQVVKCGECDACRAVALGAIRSCGMEPKP